MFVGTVDDRVPFLSSADDYAIDRTAGNAKKREAQRIEARGSRADDRLAATLQAEHHAQMSGRDIRHAFGEEHRIGGEHTFANDLRIIVEAVTGRSVHRADDGGGVSEQVR